MHDRLYRFIAPAVVALGVLLTPLVADAQDVFLNGVQVDGLTNQQFKGADVRFDAQGNIHITVTGVKVRMEQPTTGQVRTTPAQLSRQYWLVCSQNVPGMAQYTIDVQINGKPVAQIKNSDTHKVIDVTTYLVRGSNTVSFTAIKTLDDQRKSFSADHYVSLLIGEGRQTNAQLTIDNALVQYKRLASQVENHTATETFKAR